MIQISKPIFKDLVKDINISNSFSNSELVATNSEVKHVYAMLYIEQTYNNFFITLTNVKGEVFMSMSGGVSGLRGTKRRTHMSAEIVATKFLDRFLARCSPVLPIMHITAVLRTKPNIIVNTILNVFIEGQMPFLQFVETRRIPHNGMRKRKIRRILSYKILNCFY